MPDNGATLHAIIALSGYHRLLLKDKRAKLLEYRKKDDMGQAEVECCYHLFEAVRLLQQIFESPKDALSNTSIVTACILTSVTVSNYMGAAPSTSPHIACVVTNHLSSSATEIKKRLMRRWQRLLEHCTLHYC